jgi:transcriptional regulator with XRE-family HTH domain
MFAEMFVGLHSNMEKRMSQKEKHPAGEVICAPPLGDLLRRLRKAHDWSLTDIAQFRGFSNGHLSNVEIGRAKLSKAILEAYEECLEFKPHQIAALFLLLHAEIIQADSLFADISRADLDDAVKIAEVLDCFPELLEPVAVFIKKARCGLRGYLELYQPEIANELKQHHRPSLIKFKLRTLLKNLSERDL